MRLLVAVVLAALLPLHAAAAAENHVVTVEGFAFHPQTLKVRRGDTVEWVNRDILDHTATSVAPAFDSKAIHPGGRWRWTARAGGQFRYTCSFHPNMTAVIEVE